MQEHPFLLHNFPPSTAVSKPYSYRLNCFEYVWDLLYGICIIGSYCHKWIGMVRGRHIRIALIGYNHFLNESTQSLDNLPQITDFWFRFWTAPSTWIYRRIAICTGCRMGADYLPPTSEYSGALEQCISRCIHIAANWTAHGCSARASADTL